MRLCFVQNLIQSITWSGFFQGTDDDFGFLNSVADGSGPPAARGEPSSEPGEPAGTPGTRRATRRDAQGGAAGIDTAGSGTGTGTAHGLPAGYGLPTAPAAHGLPPSAAGLGCSHRLRTSTESPSSRSTTQDAAGHSSGRKPDAASARHATATTTSNANGRAATDGRSVGGSVSVGRFVGAGGRRRQQQTDDGDRGQAADEEPQRRLDALRAHDTETQEGRPDADGGGGAAAREESARRRREDDVGAAHRVARPSTGFHAVILLLFNCFGPGVDAASGHASSSTHQGRRLFAIHEGDAPTDQLRFPLFSRRSHTPSANKTFNVFNEFALIYKPPL